MKVTDRFTKFKDLILGDNLSVLLQVYDGQSYLNTTQSLEFSDGVEEVYIYAQSIVSFNNLQNYHLRGTGYFCVKAAKAWLKKEYIWIEDSTKLTLIYFERINNEEEKLGFNGV